MSSCRATNAKRFDVRALCPELSKNFRKAVADLRDRGYDVHCTSRGTPVFCDVRDTKNLGLLTLDEDLAPLHRKTIVRH